MSKISSYEIQGEVVKCSDELLELGVAPFEIAAAHMTHAMKIYRTLMSDEEYKEHMQFVLKTATDTEPFQPLTLH